MNKDFTRNIAIAIITVVCSVVLGFLFISLNVTQTQKAQNIYNLPSLQLQTDRLEERLSNVENRTLETRSMLLEVAGDQKGLERQLNINSNFIDQIQAAIIERYNKTR